MADPDDTGEESVELAGAPDGYALHLTPDYEVWLDTEIAECDGICIGDGDDRLKAIEDAIRTLIKCIAALRAQVGL